MEDIAQAIMKWITKLDLDRFQIWEALPGEGRSVRSIIQLMSKSLGMNASFVDVSVCKLVR